MKEHFASYLNAPTARVTETEKEREREREREREMGRVLLERIKASMS